VGFHLLHRLNLQNIRLRHHRLAIQLSTNLFAQPAAKSSTPKKN
jgi:hypothetical protein